MFFSTILSRTKDHFFSGLTFLTLLSLVANFFILPIPISHANLSYGRITPESKSITISKNTKQKFKMLVMDRTNSVFKLCWLVDNVNQECKSVQLDDSDTEKDSYFHTFEEPGQYTVTNQIHSITQGVFEMSWTVNVVNRGDLKIKIKDVSGVDADFPGDKGLVKLYDSDYKFLTETNAQDDNVVLFENLDLDKKYIYEVYVDNPDTYALGFENEAEFWGARSILGSEITDDLMWFERSMPYVSEVRYINAYTQKEYLVQNGEEIPYGTKIIPRLSIHNPSNISQTTRAKLYIDDDGVMPFEYEEFPGETDESPLRNITIPARSEGLLDLPAFTASRVGSYKTGWVLQHQKYDNSFYPSDKREFEDSFEVPELSMVTEEVYSFTSEIAVPNVSFGNEALKMPIYISIRRPINEKVGKETYLDIHVTALFDKEKGFTLDHLNEFDYRLNKVNLSLLIPQEQVDIGWNQIEAKFLHYADREESFLTWEELHDSMKNDANIFVIEEELIKSERLKEITQTLAEFSAGKIVDTLDDVFKGLSNKFAFGLMWLHINQNLREKPEQVVLYPEHTYDRVLLNVDFQKGVTAPAISGHIRIPLTYKTEKLAPIIIMGKTNFHTWSQQVQKLSLHSTIFGTGELFENPTEEPYDALWDSVDPNEDRIQFLGRFLEKHDENKENPRKSQVIIYGPAAPKKNKINYYTFYIGNQIPYTTILGNGGNFIYDQVALNLAIPEKSIIKDEGEQIKQFSEQYFVNNESQELEDNPELFQPIMDPNICSESHDYCKKWKNWQPPSFKKQTYNNAIIGALSNMGTFISEKILKRFGYTKSASALTLFTIFGHIENMFDKVPTSEVFINYNYDENKHDLRRIFWYSDKPFKDFKYIKMVVPIVFHDDDIPTKLPFRIDIRSKLCDITQFLIKNYENTMIAGTIDLNSIPTSPDSNSPNIFPLTPDSNSTNISPLTPTIPVFHPQSPKEGESILVSGEVQDHSENLSATEYKWTLSPGDKIFSSKNINIHDLEKGFYTLTLQIKDSNNNWSRIIFKNFSVGNIQSNSENNPSASSEPNSLLPQIYPSPPAHHLPQYQSEQPLITDFSPILSYPINGPLNPTLGLIDETNSPVVNGKIHNLFETKNPAGIPDRAAYFNGESGYISVPAKEWLNAPVAKSFSTWINIEQHNDKHYIWDDRANNGLALSIEHEKLYLYNCNGGCDTALKYPITDLLYSWHHIVATYDTDNPDSGAKLYIDGELVQEHQTKVLQDNIGEIFFGSNGGKQRFFNGAMDNIKLWNQVLTEEEIHNLHQEEYLQIFTPAFECPTSYVPVCSSDQKTYPNSCLAQKSGITNFEAGSCKKKILELNFDDEREVQSFLPGTKEYQHPTLVSNGVQGSSYFFDGDDYLYVKDKPELDVSHGAFTQELWIYPETTGGTYHGIMGYQKPKESSTRAPSLWLKNQTGIHGGFAYENKWHGYSSESIIQQQEWNHLVATFDGNIYKLYVNGEEKLSSLEFAGQKPLAQSKLLIGKIDNTFKGKMDEISIYNYALNSQTIKKHYEDLKPVQISSLPALVAHYNFNEGQGSIAYDTSGNSFHAKAFYHAWTEDELNQSLHFHRDNPHQMMQPYLRKKNSYLRLPLSLQEIPHDFTLSAWINVKELELNYYEEDSGTGEKEEVVYEIKRIREKEIGNSSTCKENGKERFCSSVRYFYFVYRYDQEKERFKLFINGRLRGYIDLKDFGDLSNDFIYLGNHEQATFFRGLAGEMEELEIRNSYERKPGWIYDQRKQNKREKYTKLTTKSPQLVFHTDFHTYHSSASQTDVVDLSENKKYIWAYKIAPAKNKTTSKQKRAIFNGKNSYIWRTADDRTNSIKEGLTMSAWIMSSAETANANETIVSKGNDTFKMYLDPVKRTIVCNFKLENGQDIKIDSTVKANQYEWNHVVCTFDAYDSAKIFVNNQLKKSVKVSKNLNTNNRDLIFGMNEDLEDSNFQGQMDEIYLYNYAIDKDKIQIIYENYDYRIPTINHYDALKLFYNFSSILIEDKPIGYERDDCLKLPQFRILLKKLILDENLNEVESLNYKLKNERRIIFNKLNDLEKKIVDKAYVKFSLDNGFAFDFSGNDNFAQISNFDVGGDNSLNITNSSKKFIVPFFELGDKFTLETVFSVYKRGFNAFKVNLFNFSTSDDSQNSLRVYLDHPKKNDDFYLYVEGCQEGSCTKQLIRTYSNLSDRENIALVFDKNTHNVQFFSNGNLWTTNEIKIPFTLPIKGETFNYFINAISDSSYFNVKIYEHKVYDTAKY